MADLQQFLVSPSSSIRDVMACIDRNGEGIALVVQDDMTLIDTVTDGDIRRTMLAGIGMATAVQSIVERKHDRLHSKPITAMMGTERAELIRIMNTHTLRQIPLLDQVGRVVDIALLSQLVKEYDLPIRAVVMAGGFGTRLLPLTKDVPKPMLQVGDRPLLEWTIENLRDAGIRRVNLTTHYKAEVISDHFKDGTDFGVEIEYVQEDSPLGTAGSLSALSGTSEPLLVMNGDILTRMNFRAMYEFHRRQHASMTVAVRQYEFRVPYGVVESDGVQVKRLVEKPVYQFFVNAGIYLLSPDVHEFIPKGIYFDMTDLITRLIEAGRKVASFPVQEYWLDIGHTEDYARAQNDVATGRF